MRNKNRGRYSLTTIIFIIYSFIIGLVSAQAAHSPSPLLAIISWLIVTPPAIYMVGVVWRFDLIPRDRFQETRDTAEQVGKRKREHIEDVLRRLTDDELMTLRHRLQDGVIDDNVLYNELVGEDGELLDRKMKL